MSYKNRGISPLVVIAIVATIAVLLISKSTEEGLLLLLISVAALNSALSITSEISRKKNKWRFILETILGKILIFAVVGISQAIDSTIVHTGLLSSPVTLYYLANQLFDLFNACEEYGVPIPDKLTKFLAQFFDKEKKANSKTNNKQGSSR